MPEMTYWKHNTLEGAMCNKRIRWCRLIMCIESCDVPVLEKIFLHVCNSNDLQWGQWNVCTMYQPFWPTTHYNNDVAIHRCRDQWSSVAVRATPARSPALNDQRRRTPAVEVSSTSSRGLSLNGRCCFHKRPSCRRLAHAKKFSWDVGGIASQANAGKLGGRKPEE